MVRTDRAANAGKPHSNEGHHRVLLPGRGYWAKLAAGQKVAKAPFRELTDDGLNWVSIQKNLTANLPPEAIEARMQAKSTIAARIPTKADERLSTGSQDQGEIHPLVRSNRVGCTKFEPCLYGFWFLPRLLAVHESSAGHTERPVKAQSKSSALTVFSGAASGAGGLLA